MRIPFRRLSRKTPRHRSALRLHPARRGLVAGGGRCGYRENEGAGPRERIVDLAIFYGRNNLLINGDIGFVPANVFATIEENLAAMAQACNDIWRAGTIGEELWFRRL